MVTKTFTTTRQSLFSRICLLPPSLIILLLRFSEIRLKSLVGRLHDTFEILLIHIPAEIIDRIDMLPHIYHLIVQMRSGSAARRTDAPDEFAATHLLPGLDQNLVQMRIFGLVAETVVQKYVFAVPSAARSRADWSPPRGRCP